VLSYDIANRLLRTVDQRGAQRNFDFNQECQLLHREVQHLEVGDIFRRSDRTTWTVLGVHAELGTVMATDGKNRRGLLFGELVRPVEALRECAIPTHRGWTEGVSYVIGRPIADLDDDRLWEQTLAESRRWQREAMAESIRRLGGYQHGCDRATARFEELHRVCEYMGLDFWDIAFNMLGFAACRLIISSVLKSKGFKDGAKEVAVHSDPAKDPRGDLVERVFRQDFI
jgi:hypothetical protein